MTNSPPITCMPMSWTNSLRLATQNSPCTFQFGWRPCAALNAGLWWRDRYRPSYVQTRERVALASCQSQGRRVVYRFTRSKPRTPCVSSQRTRFCIQVICRTTRMSVLSSQTAIRTGGAAAIQAMGGGGLVTVASVATRTTRPRKGGVPLGEVNDERACRRSLSLRDETSCRRLRPRAC